MCAMLLLLACLANLSSAMVGSDGSLAVTLIVKIVIIRKQTKYATAKIPYKYIVEDVASKETLYRT